MGKNFSLNGYSTVRKDRIGMGKGGLITLVKDSLIYTETDSHNDIECILVTLVQPALNIRYCRLGVHLYLCLAGLGFGLVLVTLLQ